MPYRIQDRLPYIGTRMAEVFEERGFYSRGANGLWLTITPGHTDVQDVSPEQIVTQVRYVDFIIFTAQLIIPTVGLTLPEHGDTILWQSSLYTLTPPAVNEDCYNFTTMLKDRLRVHCLKTT